MNPQEIKTFTPKRTERYIVVERKDSRKCEDCQADYSFCQSNKCCAFQGLDKDIKFIKARAYIE